MFNLNNSKALVTGATGGIGRAIAEMLSKAGATVVLSCLDQERLDALSQSLGDNTFPLRCDLKNTTELVDLFPEAEKQVGPIDILVCNAGINKDDIALRMKDDVWNEVLSVDLTTTFKLNQAAIKSMLRRRYGRIINISSIVGCTGNPGQANYAAAKAGIIAMSKTIALEVASRNITVNCVAPGFIDTPMTQILGEDAKTKLQERIPLGRMGTPAEIASAVLFLASKESSYITGHTLHVNGGMLMV